MARGHIYYVTPTRYPSVDFKAENYYGTLDAHGIINVKNISWEDSGPALKWLKDTMKKVGAKIGKADIPYEYNFSFDKVNKAQDAYFRPKLEKLKKSVQDLSLFDVIRSAPKLDYVLDDKHGDLIELEGTGLISVDDFVRGLKPQVTYYVYDHVILMN